MNSIFHKESLLLLLILFVPSVNYGVYYSALFFLSAFIIFSRKQFLYVKKEWLIILLSIFSFYFFVLFIRFIGYESVSDYKELVKLTLFTVVLISFKDIRINHIEKIFIVYILFNLIISISQFMHISNTLLDGFSLVYSNPNHISASLSQNSVRAIGLSEDPGSNGVISLLFYVFFLTLLLFDKRTIIRFTGVLASISVLFVTQSKSSLISAILVSAFIFSFVVFNKKKYTTNRMNLILIWLLVLFAFFWFIQDILNNFYGYKKLLNAGLEVSSMGARIDKWGEFYSAIINQDNIFMILFGAGRGFLEVNGIKSSVFDNDYIYLFVNYGLLGVLIFTIKVFNVIFNYILKFNSISISEKILLFVLFSGCVTSLAVPYYTNLKVIGIIALFLTLTFFTKKGVNI